MGIFIPRDRCVSWEPNSDLSEPPLPRVSVGDKIMGLLFPEILVVPAQCPLAGQEKVILCSIQTFPWGYLAPKPLLCI